MYSEKIHRLFSPGLKKVLKVRVYLPEEYDGSTRFPVIYMHDGQNAVHPAKWSKRSWEVTRTLERQNFPCIVVGIDSDADRSWMLCPWLPEVEDEEVKIKYARGEQYADFIVGYIKPFVDFTYKTRPDFENTYLIGSSLGGLAAAYLSARHNKVFSVVGVFSLAHFFVREHFLDYINKNFDKKATYMLSRGGKEGFDGKIDKCHAEYEQILKKKKADYFAKVYIRHVHSEECWANQFIDFVKLIKKRRKEHNVK